MTEWKNIRPDLNVLEHEYVRLLGLPVGYELAGRTRELSDWARSWYEANGHPWIYARRAKKLEVSEELIVIEDTPLTSRRLREQFLRSGADEVMLLAVSAGVELETMARKLWAEEKPDEYFFLEIFGSAVVEHLVAQASYHLCEWADQREKTVLPHYSPGYQGWNISDQKVLLGLIQSDGTTRLPGDLSVFETGMLVPKKSLLAIFGVTSHVEEVRSASGMIPCEACSLANCGYRRVPYKRHLEQAEDIRRLRPVPPAPAGDSATTASGPSYTVAKNALDKWSKERLDMKVLQDGSIEAVFRYNGTTCSNMGRPLEFHYMVRLSPPADGYRVTSAVCVPATHDAGHTAMCGYRDTGGAILDTVKEEKPLLGKPLKEIFEWKRPYSPAGCYCDSVARDHKWGLVFEVLFYALANRNGSD